VSSKDYGSRICALSEPIEPGVLRKEHLAKPGPRAFGAAIADLETFHRRWPDAMRALMAERTPIEQAVERILGRPKGIKSVISF
jgi:hypothetical protein